MQFYLGTDRPNWIGRMDVPLFVSRRVLEGRHTFPRAAAGWALDSGGFSELSMHGRWAIDARQYAETVTRISTEVGMLDWAAPQDYMCEPTVLERTGLTVDEHQRRTIENFGELRARLGPLVIPVLQGWRYGDHQAHAEAYDRAGFDLRAEPRVGVGSVCRRQNTEEVAHIVRSLRGLRLHGFGVKLGGILRLADELDSADSMAWSFRGRRAGAVCGPHRTEAHCPTFALAWRARVLERIALPRQIAMAV